MDVTVIAYFFVSSCFPLSLQQKHRDLSGQAEQLHSVCQSHKDKIKGLFETKLDEVGTKYFIFLYITEVKTQSTTLLQTTLLTSRNWHQ